jgi:hypothetical protein
LFCSGGSPDRTSVGSGPKRSSASARGHLRGSSSHACKDFLRKFVDCEILTFALKDWLSGFDESEPQQPVFDVPFDLAELQNFDYALEGVSFQQLVRMPNALYASTSDAVEATAHLAIEDFLHAGVKGLWERFWGHESATPFTVACIHSTSSKFYSAEKAIASGNLDGICATAILLKGLSSSGVSSSRGKWDQILELALLRPDIGTLSIRQSHSRRPSYLALSEALFYALRVMLSRRLSKSSTAARNSSCVYVLLVDSQYGGVVKVEGDIRTLEFDSSNVYDCAADWIKTHAKITVSPVDRIWNKLGNANWGDIGTLQILLATYCSIMQFCGPPKYALEDLATEHSSRLQSRRSERALVNNSGSASAASSMVNGNELFRFQNRSYSPEIVEVQEEMVNVRPPEETLKLEIGSIVAVEDATSQKEYEINGILSDSDPPIYHAIHMEEPSRVYMLYVGSSPSHLEPAWENMNSWYHVQRQTKVLTLMQQRGVSSKHLPQMVSSGWVVHPDECNKPSNGVSCGHRWCGTPILVTSPVGETVSDLIRKGLFGVEEALKCCHDCLAAISAASSVGIRHGDIRPENVIRVTSGSRTTFFVLIGWGRAILEDRDRPSMNLFYSSTFALQEGKLCAASDAESLIYLLYFSCGGVSPELDSVEEALQWRESSWSKRVIQQRLGDVSAVLKAFADYVDSLCGTPYPIDYEIWLRRLRRVISVDHGKEIDTSG